MDLMKQPFFPIFMLEINDFRYSRKVEILNIALKIQNKTFEYISYQLFTFKMSMTASSVILSIFFLENSNIIGSNEVGYINMQQKADGQT